MRIVKFSLACLLSLSTGLLASGGEVIGEIGTNIADSDGGLDDETTFGIKYNHYFRDDIGIQFGYNRIIGAKYKWSSSVDKTDLDRYYINGIYEPPVALLDVRPYFLLGGGYENIADEADGEKSQSFIDGAIGAKYAVSNDLDILAEAKIIQKVDSKDIDKVLTLGVGYKFGDKAGSMVSQPMEAKPVLSPFTSSQSTMSSDVDLEDTMSLPETGETVVFEESQVVEQPVESSVPQSSENMMQEGYYVQVKAYSQKKPHNSFFSDITNSGYKYVLHSANVKGQNLTKVLVGPYASYDEAKSKSKDIKTKIAQDAFVYKM